MQPNNTSKAKSFQLQSKKLGNQWHCAEFMANINTMSHKERPFYSTPIVCQQQNQEGLYLALRTERNLAILQVTSEIKLAYTMNLVDKFIRKHYRITSYEFVYSQLKRENEEHMIIGFGDGFILMVEFLSTNFINHFNIMQSDYNKETLFKQISVSRICMAPHAESFIALFLDSSIIQFSTQVEKEDSDIYKEIQEAEKKITFDIIEKEKKFKPFIGTRKVVVNNKLWMGFINEPGMELYAFFTSNIEVQKKCNPQSYYKLKCNTVTDILVLGPKSYPYQMLKNSGKTQDYEPFIIAYSGYDGKFRITDVNNLQPIFLYQSNYGGINSIVFENEKSPIVALGCQDDSTTILNLETNIYIRITGQQSFISRAIFQDIDPQILRIVSASYDGTIAFKEIEKSQLYQEESKTQDQPQQQQQQQQDNNNSLPKKLIYDKNTAIQLEYDDDEIQVVNKGGIGYIQGSHRFVFTSAFDGCCSCWKFMDENTVMSEQQQQQ